MRFLAAATFIVLCGASAGCSTVVVSARNSVNPVLLGPVKTLSSAPEPAAEQLGTFHSLVMDTAWSSSAGYTSESRKTTSAVTEADWDVLLSTNGDPRRYIVVDRLACSGYDAYWIFMVDRDYECKLTGTVQRPLAVPLWGEKLDWSANHAP